MLRVGIDAIRFYIPPFALNLATLAEERGVDPQKYLIGLGQEQMAVMPPDEDVVSMAANAALPLIENSDTQNIRMVLFATESGVDQSKAGGLWVHHLLSLPSSCRVIEVKQACYSGTCALQLAATYLLCHPEEKVLLIASDNARYGLKTSGEPTQGCGAVAMLLSASPRLLALEPHQGIVAQHVMDFWRPNYLSEAVVDGKYSTKVYINVLLECWKDYAKQSGRLFTDHSRYCYHLPFTRIAEKAHERLAKHAAPDLTQEFLRGQLQPSLQYSKKLGNAYTAALYIGLASLLENDKDDLSGQRIGFFSYGSGCVGEFFSGIVQPGYQKALAQDEHKALLSSRQILCNEEYESFFNYQLPEDGGEHSTPYHTAGRFRLIGIDNHERLYGAR